VNLPYRFRELRLLITLPFLYLQYNANNVRLPLTKVGFSSPIINTYRCFVHKKKVKIFLAAKVSQCCAEGGSGWKNPAGCDTFNV
jgi:hypothetical protein